MSSKLVGSILSKVSPTPTTRRRGLVDGSIKKSVSDSSILVDVDITTLPTDRQQQDNNDEDLKKNDEPSPLTKTCSTVCTDSIDVKKSKAWILQEQVKLQRRIPLLKKLVDLFHRLPYSLKMAAFILWLIWKVTITLLFLRVLFIATYVGKPMKNLNVATTTRILQHNDSPNHIQDGGINVLYIVTALAEYNSGKRETKKGQDRLGEVMLPVLIDSVESMVTSPFNYNVDVYLILGYELRPDRFQMINDRLPPNVNLNVWDDASPLGYVKEKSSEAVFDNTRALARQHRYVIKDNMHNYDLFCVFEDDMRITGEHINHYLQMSNEITKLTHHAPNIEGYRENMDKDKQSYYEQMTKVQMKRLLPGFIRVEVLVDETTNGAQKTLDPIERDYIFTNPEHNTTTTNEERSQIEIERHINPQTCCHVQNMKPNVETPVTPSYRDVIVWETSVKALSLRHMPNSTLLDWVVLLLGPGKRLEKEALIGGYWSGRDGAYGKAEPKPSGAPPNLFAQQGGFMLTRNQIMLLNEQNCMGSFLPPFGGKWYHDDGQQAMNVEFWSGGYQLFTGVAGGCNMQRIVSYDPNHFSKHLLYHVANNKQKQLAQNRMVRADDIFGQLNSVRKSADESMKKSLAIAASTTDYDKTTVK